MQLDISLFFGAKVNVASELNQNGQIDCVNLIELPRPREIQLEMSSPKSSNSAA